MRMRLQMEKIEESTGESEERQPAQGPASIKRRIKSCKGGCAELHRRGRASVREKAAESYMGGTGSTRADESHGGGQAGV